MKNNVWLESAPASFLDPNITDQFFSKIDLVINRDTIILMQKRPGLHDNIFTYGKLFIKDLHIKDGVVIHVPCTRTLWDVVTPFVTHVYVRKVLKVSTHEGDLRITLLGGIFSGFFGNDFPEDFDQAMEDISVFFNPAFSFSDVDLN